MTDLPWLQDVGPDTILSPAQWLTDPKHRKHIYVVGGPRSGKTNFLRSLVKNAYGWSSESLDSTEDQVLVEAFLTNDLMSVDEKREIRRREGKGYVIQPQLTLFDDIDFYLEGYRQRADEARTDAVRTWLNTHIKKQSKNIGHLLVLSGETVLPLIEDKRDQFNFVYLGSMAYSQAPEHERWLRNLGYKACVINNTISWRF